MESGWLYRIRQTRLYCYSLPPENFRLLDSVAGYYVSGETVHPVQVTSVDDLIDAMLKRGAELRFTPNLWPLANAVAASTLHFSLLRMRNAASQ